MWPRRPSVSSPRQDERNPEEREGRIRDFTRCRSGRTAIAARRLADTASASASTSAAATATAAATAVATAHADTAGALSIGARGAVGDIDVGGAIVRAAVARLDSITF